MVPRLRNSIVIQDNSIGILLNSFLAKLPTILDSFFTTNTSDYEGVVDRGIESTGCKVTLTL